MKTIYLFLFPILFASCKESADCCTVVDTSVDIHLLDEDGNNWLSQQQLYEGNINVYFLKDGKKEKTFRGNLDSPKMFTIRGDAAGEEVMQLYPSDYIENNKSRTLIEFSAAAVDTVDCLFSTSNNNLICKEVWYNGKSVWNSGQHTPRVLEIVKE